MPPCTCSVCGSPHATFHICQPPQASAAYCERCVPAHLRDWLEETLRANCTYCGAWPANTSVLPFIHAAPRSLCSNCALEFHRVFLGKINDRRIGDLPPKDQIRQLEQAGKAADLHMRRRASVPSPQ